MRYRLVLVSVDIMVAAGRTDTIVVLNVLMSDRRGATSVLPNVRSTCLGCLRVARTVLILHEIEEDLPEGSSGAIML